MTTKRNVCRYGHENNYREWVSPSGVQKRVCRTCASIKNTAARTGATSKHAPAMVARYDIQIIEAQAKIVQLQNRIAKLSAMREKYISKDA